LTCRLHELCNATLVNLQATTRTADQFFKVAIEASDAKLIEEQKFREWFVSHIRSRHEKLLPTFDIDDNAAKLCSILVSAVALTSDVAPPKTPKSSSRPPPTPPTSGPRSQAKPSGFDGASSPDDVKLENPILKRARKEKTKRSANPTTKTKSTPQHTAKKRKYQVKVEEVADSDILG
jgi:hypothetical protein